MTADAVIMWLIIAPPGEKTMICPRCDADDTREIGKAFLLAAVGALASGVVQWALDRWLPKKDDGNETEVEK